MFETFNFPKTIKFKLGSNEQSMQSVYKDRLLPNSKSLKLFFSNFLIKLVHIIACNVYYYAN